MITSEREQFLQHLALFSDLVASELRALADVAQVVQFPAWALIFREGEVGDCAYVVVRGSVQVFATDRNGDEVVLAQLKELSHVGEQSLLPGRSERRNASLRACEDTTLLRIPKAEFQKVLTQRHTLKDLLSQTGQQQVRANMIRTARLARSSCSSMASSVSASSVGWQWFSRRHSFYLRSGLPPSYCSSRPRHRRQVHGTRCAVTPLVSLADMQHCG